MWSGIQFEDNSVASLKLSLLKVSHLILKVQQLLMNCVEVCLLMKCERYRSGLYLNLVMQSACVAQQNRLGPQCVLQLLKTEQRVTGEGTLANVYLRRRVIKRGSSSG